MKPEDQPTRKYDPVAFAKFKASPLGKRIAQIATGRKPYGSGASSTTDAPGRVAER